MVQALAPTPTADAGRALARQASEQLLLGATDSAMVLLEAALRAAPDDAGIHLTYILRRWEDGEFRATAAQYRARTAGSPEIRACLAALTDFSFAPGYDSVAMARAQGRLRAMRPSPPARSCVLTAQAFLAYRAINPREWDQAMLTDLERAMAATPQAAILWLDVLNAMKNVAPQRVSEHCRAGRATLLDPVGRFTFDANCISARFAIGDTARAVSEYRALSAAVRRDGRPGLLLRLRRDVDTEVQQFADGIASAESIRRETLALARRIGDWRNEYFMGVIIGRFLINAGEPARAVADLDAALVIAERHRRPFMELRALGLRGRALTRAGRPEEALIPLRRAVAFGHGVDDVYELAEAYHNLAHAYEALGRWREAAAAADEFVALTSPFQWDGLRVIALRDAGEIRRKAGWHAAANADYERMVRVVDEVDAHHQWAGEYLERRGLLRPAAEMYRRGIALPSRDPLDLAGLARILIVLGQLDSAATVARLHDAERADWRPGEVPLLPDVLAHQGRVSEARRILADWAATRMRGGDVHGAALAQLAWGRMALRDGALVDALRASIMAESLATLAAAPGEALSARLLRARLLALRGATDSALSLVQGVAADRILVGNPGLRFEAAVVAGDLAARAGRTPQALASYAEASQVVDTVSVALVADFDRAAYRDRHLAPFDSALALLQRETPLRPALLAEWSARRKAAALRFVDGGGVAIPAIASLQRRLPAGTLVLDYVLARDYALVVAITRSGVRAVRLDASSTGIVADVARARRGFDDQWLGRVDLARVRTDSAALRRLSHALLQPVAADLRAATQVLIAPDDALVALPFEMLPDPNRQDRPFLLAAAVGYLPGTWAIGTSRAHRGQQVLVVAQDAPGAESERLGVRSAWPRTAVAELAGSSATEEGILDRRRTAGILHIVAHAVNDSRDPKASHLRLSPGTTSDGYLHTVEIGAWRGMPSLVILSACATASGAPLAGEGAFSLSRAFLRAGAHEVVATHWPIGAAAAPVAARMHQELAAGRTTLEALTLARRALYANPETSHPFYWASFVLMIADSP